MVPVCVEPLFWDTDLKAFEPRDYPDYAIFRVLEFGDEAAVEWMRDTFSESEIRRVLSFESRLTEKSANFWALVYGMVPDQVAALRRSRWRP